MDHTVLDQGMFWVGTMFVVTPMVFAGILLGVWWRARKREQSGQTGASADKPVS